MYKLNKYLSKSVLWLALAAMLGLNFARAQTTVNVALVEARGVLTELSLSGNVVSSKRVEIGSEVAAQVVDVYVEVGDVVAKSQPLLQLQDQPSTLALAVKQAQLREDRAAVTLAALEERRLKKLLQKKSVSAESYDQVVARLQQARAAFAGREAEIAQLQDGVDRHRIKAPFAGVIVERPVEQGSWAAVGAALVELASLQSLRMELSVPQRYYAALSAAAHSMAHNDATLSMAVHSDTHGRAASGLAAFVYADSTQSPVEAKLQRVMPFANSQRNFQVWLALDNTGRQWLPGMSAQAQLRWQNSDEHTLSVPRDALVRNVRGETVVWKVVPALASKKLLEAGASVTGHPGVDTAVDLNKAEDSIQQWQAVPISVSVGAGGDQRVAVRPLFSSNSEKPGEQVAVVNQEDVTAFLNEMLVAGDSVVTRGNESLQAGQRIKPILLREANPR